MRWQILKGCKKESEVAARSPSNYFTGEFVRVFDLAPTKPVCTLSQVSACLDMPVDSGAGIVEGDLWSTRS